MCAVSAATLAQLWRNVLSRIVVIATIALQLVWGARWAVKLFPLYSLERVLWASSARDWDDQQMSRWYALYRVGRAIPRNAVVMVHDERIRLGLRRSSVSDSLGFETRLSMGDLGTDANIFDQLSALGVTHLHLSGSSRGFVTLADDLLYGAFFFRYGHRTGDRTLRTMPRVRPASGRSSQRLVFIDVCKRVSIATGLYRAIELKEVTYGMPLYLQAPPVRLANDSKEAASLEDEAEFLLLADSCPVAMANTTGFDFMISREGYNLYLKHTP
jgi:hypothetical protein